MYPKYWSNALKIVVTSRVSNNPQRTLVVGDRKDYSVLVYNATSSGISLARFVNDQVT